MRRSFARVLTAPLAVLAAAAVLPLASQSAAADEGIVGGHQVDASNSPWVVALASRDRFGGTRAGQFCGGVVVGRSTVLTAAHCLSEDVLGVPRDQVRDLKAIVGRGDLETSDGAEVSVRSEWINPAYDGRTNAA